VSDEPVEILWKQVLEAWGEEKRHQAFLGFCHERGQLADAARYYKALADEKDGGRYRATESQREDAKKRLAAIIAMAFATIDAAPRASVPQVRRWLNITALALFVITLCFLAWMLLRVRGVATD
jgi:hypothetical protein